MSGLDGYLTTAQVATLLHITPGAVRMYRSRSKPGGIYAHNPFPEPDTYVNGDPVWKKERTPKLLEWMASRAGRGHGGGPKPRKR